MVTFAYLPPAEHPVASRCISGTDTHQLTHGEPEASNWNSRLLNNSREFGEMTKSTIIMLLSFIEGRQMVFCGLKSWSSHNSFYIIANLVQQPMSLQDLDFGVYHFHFLWYNCKRVQQQHNILLASLDLNFHFVSFLFAASFTSPSSISRHADGLEWRRNIVQNTQRHHICSAAQVWRCFLVKDNKDDWSKANLMTMMTRKMSMTK